MQPSRLFSVPRSLTGNPIAATLVGMCNLYAEKHPRELVAGWFCVSDNRAAQITPRQAIFPGMNAAVVRRADDGERELLELSWGFVLLMQGKAPKRVTNTRDTRWIAAFGPLLCARDAVWCRFRRFPNPKGKGPAIWHWFALNDDRDLFSFAGIWRYYKGPIKKDGETVEIDTFSFMTTTANDVVGAVHPRMPVLLAGQDACDQWIDGSEADAKGLTKPFPDEQMKVVQASEEKKDLAA